MLLKYFIPQVYHSLALNGKYKSLKCDYGADESEVAERMSERADTAYSPRFREEEHSAATEQIMAYFPKCDYGADEITLTKLALLRYLGDAAARSGMCAREEKSSA